MAKSKRERRPRVVEKTTPRKKVKKLKEKTWKRLMLAIYICFILFLFAIGDSLTGGKMTQAVIELPTYILQINQEPVRTERRIINDNTPYYADPMENALISGHLAAGTVIIPIQQENQFVRFSKDGTFYWVKLSNTK